jgi:enoyl-CoA hydratase
MALVTYKLEGPVATIAMDDGKMNALSLAMLTELNDAFDRAQADQAVTILTGREGVFSAGFDLKTLRAGGADAYAMLRAGFALGTRLLAFPTPLFAAVNGHAMAMGAFLMMCADHRVGTAGPFKLTVNEVAIGLTMPRAGVEICRQRLTPAHFSSAVLLAHVYTPKSAVEAGFLDRVVPASELQSTVSAFAAEATKLDMRAHAATKLCARGPVLEALRVANEADDADFRAIAGA